MPQRVLIVDDQEDVLNLLMRFLSGGDYDVVGLMHFDEAKTYIDQTPPDALITDIRLGAFNGLQLALHMRAVRPTAPVIVLSAWDDPALRQEAVSLGAHYVTKPLTKAELLDCLAGTRE